MVIALDPQSTMDPRVVPWETRFAEARRQDWTGPFADARAGAAKAKAI